MRKGHKDIIEFLSKTKMPAIEWVKTRWFWKHKKCIVYWSSFEIYYHNTCIILYAWDVSSVMIGFWWEEFRTNSTAGMLKDLVEWIFWFKRLPRWNWVVDEYWDHYIFEDSCKLVIRDLPLNHLKIYNEKTENSWK